jgi:hypothetical protein
VEHDRKSPRSRPVAKLATGFTPKTELLSDVGWVRADVLYEQARTGPAMRIAQYLPETEAIEFVKPIVRESIYVGTLIRLRTDKKIDLILQPEHRCLLSSRQGQLNLMPAREYHARSLQLQGGHYAGGQKHLSPEQVSWLCAVQADGSFKRKSTIIFNFSKARKCDRLTAVMKKLGIHYTDHTYQHGVNKAFRTFSIGPGENRALRDWTFELLGPDKTFGPWLLDLDRATLDCFIEEVLNWDGKFKTRDCYFSVDPRNTDWVQILWTLSGRRSRVLSYPGLNSSFSERLLSNCTPAGC